MVLMMWSSCTSPDQGSLRRAIGGCQPARPSALVGDRAPHDSKRLPYATRAAVLRGACRFCFVQCAVTWLQDDHGNALAPAIAVCCGVEGAATADRRQGLCKTDNIISVFG